MANKPRFAIKDIIEALQATKGMVHLAAERLGCTHNTIYNYIKRHPSIQATVDAERGKVLDVTELALFRAIQNGEGWAIAFCLKTIGKERGYVERNQVELLQKELDSTLTKLERSLEPELYERILSIISEVG